jgi:hypothetical protein
MARRRRCRLSAHGIARRSYCGWPSFSMRHCELNGSRSHATTFLQNLKKDDDITARYIGVLVAARYMRNVMLETMQGINIYNLSRTSVHRSPHISHFRTGAGDARLVIRHREFDLLAARRMAVRNDPMSMLFCASACPLKLDSVDQGKSRLRRSNCLLRSVGLTVLVCPEGKQPDER